MPIVNRQLLCYAAGMQAEFSVELGVDDPRLAVPWASPDGRLRYFDLKNRPEMLRSIEEAEREPALGQFLVTVNSRNSCVQSAKSDVWSTTELDEEEAAFRAARKFASYVDLVFLENAARFSFQRHENFARRLAELLQRAPEIPARAEFILRHCDYGGDEREGFCITFYCSGYAQDEAEARKRWTIALKLVENAILQLSARLRAEQTSMQ